MNNLLKEIIALRRFKKRGFGEKSLFDLLYEFRKSNNTSLLSYISENRERYEFSESEVSSILENCGEAEKIISMCEDTGVKISTLCDIDFPNILLENRILPVFFYRGDLSIIGGRNIAIVGSRTPTSYGIDSTEKIVKIIANYANVVSGGAFGIDTAAHSSALKFGGKTIVFFGTSINNPYPSSNTLLFDKIVDSGGLVISAFGPCEETNEFSFVRRNEYIATVCQAVIVIEGGEKSGAGLTAEYAFKRSIPVFALPGPITSEKSYCPNYLISKGARIIYSEKVISDFLGIVEEDSSKTAKRDFDNQLSDDELSLLNILENNVYHVDELFLKLKKQPSELSELLLRMELKGIIEQLPGKIYRKRSN
ncbi:MAG: DNA-protecting protein DprA [Deltaproteobacteria bacterium]|nr:DNA-protecting protein DprA [Deltaproteobacteria bacterium]